MRQDGGAFREADLVVRISHTKMSPALVLSCASRFTRYESRSGNGYTEEFTGAGQKQPGQSVHAETRLYGPLEKPRWPRTEVTAVWS